MLTYRGCVSVLCDLGDDLRLMCWRFGLRLGIIVLGGVSLLNEIQPQVKLALRRMFLHRSCMRQGCAIQETT